MITPEPRLSDRRSRGPKRSWSPKKYRKNGSFENGEAGARTTCREEILATPFTAWVAMRVKSGPAAAANGALRCVSSVAAGAAIVSARGSDALRIRPVTTSPATKPAAIGTSETKTLRSIEFYAGENSDSKKTGALHRLTRRRRDAPRALSPWE